MAGVACQISISSSSTLRRVNHRRRCFSGSPENKTPAVLKWAVGGVTELLRLFSGAPSSSSIPTNKDRSKYELSAGNVDDVMEILRSDYRNAYFVTGILTSSIYSDECIFEDPTISFQGTELYERNLKLLVPFLEDASIELQNMDKSESSERNYILATWKLRTYLKLPWRPLISINGSTVYDLDRDFKIVRHVESWNVSALEAVGQIFTVKSFPFGD
ncbi:NTF2-like domain superfamily [Arabidopsis suecica]|uniref:NTF2-like domain superfamily n=1 Tax=Arabidopsis suecica TaxID=45249 RepID=A0A8T2B1S4_ARASU|nr:NTF2-like domain superfamily [Arabidopsis suecica]